MTGPLRLRSGQASASLPSTPLRTGPSASLRTGLLASVASLAEARLVLEGGADIIDLKNPAAGALGALDHETVRLIVEALAATKPVSATVGDLPMQPAVVLQAVEAMASTGVDYVKIGFFPGGDWAGCLAALAPAARRRRLIAVLFADQPPQPSWLEAIAAAGFAGAMLDTMDKTQGGLRQRLDAATLAEFVRQARELGLLCGLAGSLCCEDIAHLLPLQPDYLGFRGALCESSRRTAGLSLPAVARIRGLIPA